MWKIQFKGWHTRWTYYDTLEEARKAASDYFTRTGIVVGIVAAR
jgi:hypothetical protein